MPRVLGALGRPARLSCTSASSSRAVSWAEGPQVSRAPTKPDAATEAPACWNGALQGQGLPGPHGQFSGDHAALVMELGSHAPSPDTPDTCAGSLFLHGSGCTLCPNSRVRTCFLVTPISPGWVTQRQLCCSRARGSTGSSVLTLFPAGWPEQECVTETQRCQRPSWAGRG